MPASLRILDTGVPFDGALDLMSEDLDIGRKLALLRQDMAGFSGTSMLSNLDWRGGNGLFTLP